MECKHKNLSRGIYSPTGKFYTFCQDCNKRWYDGGKRWQNDPKAQAKVRAWERERAKILAE